MSIDMPKSDMSVRDCLQSGYSALALGRGMALDDPAHPYHRRLRDAEKLAQKAYREHKRVTSNVTGRIMGGNLTMIEWVNSIMEDRVATAKIVELYTCLITPEDGDAPQMQYAIPLRLEAS